MALLSLLPIVPGETFLNKFLIALLVIVFGFIFVTVSSRIVGLIGSSSNPISGMTIATLMATAMVFVGLGWTGSVYEPMALVVGGMMSASGRDLERHGKHARDAPVIGARCGCARVRAGGSRR